MANYVWTNEGGNGLITNPANYRVYDTPYPIATAAPGAGDAVHVGQEYCSIVTEGALYNDASSWAAGQTVPFIVYFYYSVAPPIGTVFNGRVQYPADNSPPIGLIFNGIVETMNDFIDGCTFNGPVIWYEPNCYNVFQGTSNTYNHYLQLGFAGTKLYSLNSPDIPRGGSGPAIGPARISIGS